MAERREQSLYEHNVVHVVTSGETLLSSRFILLVLCNEVKNNVALKFCMFGHGHANMLVNDKIFTQILLS